MLEAKLERLRDVHKTMKTELQRVIVGQEKVLDQLLLAIMTRGHCLLVGVPGLAKTLMISSLAKTMDLKFNRIQFTPDLMPSDITGTELLHIDPETNARTFRFEEGPLFTNVLLADEINRTPPKTQAALLEAMQERHVTSGGKTHQLPKPFFVLATQNPIEQEGTYPLPEAQLDRFMFLVRVEYPSLEEEMRIVEMTTKPMKVELEQVLTGQDIIEIQDIVRRVPISEHVVRYVLNLVRATRVSDPSAPELVRQRVAWGAGPRASQFMILGAKARALLKGRLYVSIEDVQAVALPVLRHRVLTTYGAEAEGYTSDRLIAELMELMPSADSESLRDERLPNVLGS